LASLISPGSIAMDTLGGLVATERGAFKVRRIDLQTGIITTIAGRRSGFSGDGGPATAAELNAPRGLALDAAGSVYIADSTNHRIRRIDPNGAITTVAGNGRAELSGDGQPAMNAALNSPRAVAFDVQGNLWIADTFNHRIRRIDSSGAIHSITAPDLNSPRGIAVMVSGEVIVSDSGNRRIRKIDRLGNTSTIADAPLNEPYGIAIDGAGILVIADRGNNRVRKIVEGEGRFTPFGILPGPPVMVTVAGNGQRDYIGDDGLAIAASFRSPSAIAIDTSGNVFIADTANHRVRGIDKRTGIVTTIAGTGQLGFSGDGGPATLAALNSPQGLAVDRNDNLYIADTNNHRIRKVDRSGGIVTFAGSVQLSFPTGLAIAGDNLYIADTSNHRVRRVNTSTGAVVTIGETTEDSLNSPRDVALDSSGNLFIADTGNNRIRKIDTRSLSISTIGTAVLNFPLGLDVDAAGSVVILDSFSHVIRKVESQSGAMLTIAGTGTPGFSGDGGPAVAATMFAPGGVRIDPITGNILFTDTVNNRIRGIRKPN